MTCAKPDCSAGLIRVERCQEFKTVRYRWGCAAGHSGFLADDLPEYGRPVEPWGRRRGPSREPVIDREPVICGECHEPLPPGVSSQRQFHAVCSVVRNARSVREYDKRRGAERRSTRKAVAS